MRQCFDDILNLLGILSRSGQGGEFQEQSRALRHRRTIKWFPGCQKFLKDLAGTIRSRTGDGETCPFVVGAGQSDFGQHRGTLFINPSSQGQGDLVANTGIRVFGKLFQTVRDCGLKWNAFIKAYPMFPNSRMRIF